MRLFAPQYGRHDVAEGVRLARNCSHPDAQWLVSLFPTDAVVGAAEMERAMHVCGDDPRALYILSSLTLSNSQPMLLVAAEMGYAPAQADWADHLASPDSLQWAQRAAANGDRHGLFLLGWWLLDGRHGAEKDEVAGLALLREAAALGEDSALWRLGEPSTVRAIGNGTDCGVSRPRGGNGFAITNLLLAARELLSSLPVQSGRVLFELGSAFRGVVSVASCSVFEIHAAPKSAHAAQRCIEMHDRWCSEARSAIRCWLLLSRRLGVAKDLRRVISQMLWDQRAEWSKGPVEKTQ
jgi:hypothetical protein